MKFPSIAAVICTSSLLIYSFRQQRILTDQLKEKERIVDSLNSENFVLGTIITRYQIAEECIQEKDSLAHSKYDDCLSQTE